MAPNAKIIVASAGVNPEEWSPDKSIKREPFLLTYATFFKLGS